MSRAGVRIGRRRFLGLASGGIATLSLGCGQDSESTPGGADVSDVTDITDSSSDAGTDIEPCAGPPFDLQDVPEDLQVFPHPIQAAPLSGGLCLAAYTAPPGATWLVWPEGGDADCVVRLGAGDATVLPGAAATRPDWAKDTVQGLTPGTVHNVALVTGPEDAPTARSRITKALVPHSQGVAPVVTLAATSCTKYWYMPYKALTVASQRPYDAFLHLGDMSYNDDAVTLEDYRTAWGGTLSDPGYVDLLTHGAILNTWDDHEIANNDWTELPEEQLAAGKQAFFEATATLTDPAGRLWRSVRWGDTVEAFVLDCRGERRPETRETADAVFISQAQLDWLVKALTDSPCRFKLVMTSVPMAKFPDTWPKADVWAGYASQREALLSAVAGKVAGLLFVSGDHHFGSVHKVETDGARSALWEVLAGPGAASPNPLVGAVELSPELAETYVPAAQFSYYSTRNAATEMVFDPAAGTVVVRFIDGETNEIAFETTLSP